MDNVLLVSKSEKSTDSLSGLLREISSPTIDIVRSGSEARRILIEKEYDFVFINTPLTDEFGDGLSIYVSENTHASVVLLVKAEIEEQAEAKTEDYGVFVLSKPLSKHLMFKSIKLLEATKRRLEGVRKENIKLQKKIEDIRTINRAKYVLMEYLSMSEPQSHRYLERQAMDQRITKVEVAKRILSTYEN